MCLLTLGAIAVQPVAGQESPRVNVVTTDDGGEGSLRKAIIAANARPGHDTIVLPAGNYTLNLERRSANE